jgi:transcriptional regulator with XRE-family HTH domain
MKKKKAVTSKEIGAMIKKRRRELGISQEELAEALGVTYQQIQRYENGTNKLNVENLQLIAEMIQMPAPLFFEGMTAEKPSIHVQPEEMKLLKLFRTIKDRASRDIVMKVAMLAARDKENPV